MNEQKNTKTALVMEGGGMRGMFTCGVIDVFMQNDVTFDVGVGVSAGATFGCNIKSEQIDRAHRYIKKYCRDKRYSSVSSFLKTGDLFNVEFCYHTLPDELDVFDRDAFVKNPMQFYAVATSVSTGKAVYHLCFDGKTADIEWIRASASLPVISRPVEIDGDKYLDGGISDSIPIDFAKSLGSQKIVAVLTRDSAYKKRKSKFLAFVKIGCRKYPAIVDALKHRHEEYNKQTKEIRRLEDAGEIFVIRPPRPLDLKVTEKDPKKLDEAYDIGRETALSLLADLKSYLAK